MALSCCNLKLKNYYFVSSNKTASSQEFIRPCTVGHSSFIVDLNSRGATTLLSELIYVLSSFVIGLAKTILIKPKCLHELISPLHAWSITYYKVLLTALDLLLLLFFGVIN